MDGREGGSREHNRMRVPRFAASGSVLLTRFSVFRLSTRVNTKAEDSFSLSLLRGKKIYLFYRLRSRVYRNEFFFSLISVYASMPRAIIYSRSNIIARSTACSLFFFYTRSFISLQIPLAIRRVKNTRDRKVYYWQIHIIRKNVHLINRCEYFRYFFFYTDTLS